MSILDESMQQDAVAPEPAVQAVNIPSINFDWLKAPTGEGSVEDYMNEPLNFDRTKGTARILRGLSGMVGSLNLAVIDIVIGAFEKIREGKSNGAV